MLILPSDWQMKNEIQIKKMKNPNEIKKQMKILFEEFNLNLEIPTDKVPEIKQSTQKCEIHSKKKGNMSKNK